MARRGSFLIALLLLFGTVPGVAAQSVPQMLGATDRCVKACDAGGLNGPLLKRGNETTWVVL